MLSSELEKEYDRWKIYLQGLLTLTYGTTLSFRSKGTSQKSDEENKNIGVLARIIFDNPEKGNNLTYSDYAYFLKKYRKLKVFFRKSVEKDLAGVPKKDVAEIFDRIRALGHNPRPYGCEKLTGQERYRLRQGRYRIVYSIQDDELTVWIVTIGHRKDVYR